MKEKAKEQAQTVSLPDGRKLGYLIVGEGKPVFYLHGYPGSAVHALCLRQVASSRHLQIIAVDLPGAGLSTYSPNRRYRDDASDIAFLADRLGIEKFALVGHSAGGHRALTCAAWLSKRLTLVVVISGKSLPAQNRILTLWGIWFAVGSVPVVNTLFFRIVGNVVRKVAKDMDAFAKSRIGRIGLRSASRDDVKFVTLPSDMRDLELQGWVESFQQGSDAIKAQIQEVKLQKRGWEVDLSQIPAGLVHIWHGSGDTMIEVKDASKNARAIPGAHLKIFEGEGHLLLLNHLEELGELLSS